MGTDIGVQTNWNRHTSELELMNDILKHSVGRDKRKGFLQQTLEVWKGGPIVKLWEAARPNHHINLFLSFGLTVWMTVSTRMKKDNVDKVLKSVKTSTCNSW